MTQEQVLNALQTVQEPDLGKDIVTLNMVKDIQIEGNLSGSATLQLKSEGPNTNP